MVEASESSRTVRVVIIDDYDMIRRGLVLILSVYDDIEVVAEANQGETAVALCQQHRPDVALMDVRMPRQDGIEATRRIREISPTTQVIGLTSYEDEEKLQGMLKAGAIGCLMKNVTGDELASAIRRAAEGLPTFSPEMAHLLVQAVRRAPVSQFQLTERELEVLALVSQGLTNREISERLTISSSTVKNHVSNLLAKLDVTSRAKLAAMAIEHGLLK
jgi:NarL family two-component system response regulator LiaR